MPKRKTSNSDNIHEIRRKSVSSDHLFDVRSHVDLLRRIDTKVDEGHRKNRLLLVVIGVLMLLVETAATVVKYLKGN